MIRGRRRFVAWGSRVLLGFMLVVVAVLVFGVVTGYRLVVLTSSSMAPIAPAGSLLVVHPVAARGVQVGDVLVLQRESGPVVTHRIVELRRIDGHDHAITQGDANDLVDAEPYRLGNDNLVVRWIAPGAGDAFVDHRRTIALIGLLGAGSAIALVAVVAMRRVLSRQAASP